MVAFVPTLDTSEMTTTVNPANRPTLVDPRLQPQTAPVAPAVDFGAAPPTGLIGSEEALQTAQTGALGELTSARDLSIQDLTQAGQLGAQEIRGGRAAGTEFLGQAIGGFEPFAQEGTSAGNIQAALSGALGVEAQQQALANLQPINTFLQEEGERAVARNAARLGGLGGGNVLKDLTRFGQGLAGQSAQQQFENLGTVAERGFGAVQNIGTLRSSQANLAAQASRDISDTLGRTAQDVSTVRGGAATNIANVFGGTGQQVAAGRTRAGEQIATAIGGTTSALADLAAQQGAGISDITGGISTQISNLLATEGLTEAQIQQQLATLLANIGVQEGSTVAGLPSIPGTQQTPGILEDVAKITTAAGTL